MSPTRLREALIQRRGQGRVSGPHAALSHLSLSLEPDARLAVCEALFKHPIRIDQLSGLRERATTLLVPPFLAEEAREQSVRGRELWLALNQVSRRVPRLNGEPLLTPETRL